MLDIRLPSILASLSIFATSSKILTTRSNNSLPASFRDISRPLNMTVTFNLSPDDKKISTFPGMDTNKNNFIEFLEEALNKYENEDY